MLWHYSLENTCFHRFLSSSILNSSQRIHFAQKYAVPHRNPHSRKGSQVRSFFCEVDCVRVCVCVNSNVYFTHAHVLHHLQFWRFTTDGQLIQNGIGVSTCYNGVAEKLCKSLLYGRPRCVLTVLLYLSCHIL